VTALSNLDAERTVLGCALSDTESAYRVLPLLRAQDFSLDSHRRIFYVIAELGEAGKPIDELTVTNALLEKRQLESVGGVSYVTSLTQNVDAGMARVTHVEHYAQLILDKSRRRKAAAAGTVLVSATQDSTVTTEECLANIQHCLLQIEASADSAAARHVKEFMPEVLRELETQAQNEGLVGMSTGIPSLDSATGGIRLGELYTIGALPGRGKTAFGTQVVLANGAVGIPTYVFSLEMQDLEIGKRFLAAKSCVPAIQIRNPQMIKQERWKDLIQAAAEISEWPIYVDSRSSVTIQELLASARLFIRREGVKLIIVDYLRLVDAPGRDLRERVGNVANALRQLAKSEHVGVVLLSQLKRPEGGINARPSMLDLKESGDIEAHSHVVVLPYLPIGDDGVSIPDEQLLILGKNRNGSSGSLPVYFDEKRLQFFDRASFGNRPKNPSDYANASGHEPGSENR
jgi:replicative DNA helicase